MQIVYSYITSPIRHIPGPLWNRVSYWPLRLATISGKRIYYVDKLHQEYGVFAFRTSIRH